MNNQELLNNEYPLPKDSYAAFDAISLRNLILTRLNNQGVFTDQNYIGSNLASIIDIISYSFNTLLFYLNKTSTESMFTEAQLYENITRIVKLLDYKPIGYQTSTLSFQVSTTNALQAGVYTIPRYSYLTVGNIPFSFNEDISFNVLQNNTVQTLTDVSNRKILYQGIYKEHPIYTANGDPNEAILINSSSILIDHFNIDVYVYENQTGQWTQYENTPNIYTEEASRRVFEKRLNSSQQYEIVFGDNIHGKQLQNRDRVAVYYLQSSGESGVIGPNYLQVAEKSVFNTLQFANIYNNITGTQFNLVQLSNVIANLLFNNVAGSTQIKNIESVESIRQNAPSNFKSQYRLVTKQDYESFIKTNFANFVSDVKVFSNWDYTGKYLKYFNDIQVSPTAFRQVLFNQVLYADSCNFNNVYICAIPKVSPTSTLKYLLPAQKEAMLSNIGPLKTLTTEVVYLDPIYKAVALGAVDVNREFVIGDENLCRLEVVKASNSRRSNQSIIDDIKRVFSSFFNVSTNTIGNNFNYNGLITSLLNIEGVSNFRTRRLDTNDVTEGLSFFVWNPNYPELDKQVVTSNLPMREFEFFYYTDLTFLFANMIIDESEIFIQ